MIKIKLYGHLGKLFGSTHYYAVKTPIEVIRALQANFPSFRKSLHDKAVAGYKVIIDSKDKSHQDYFNNEITSEIKLIPVLRGAGGNNQGWGMIVMAVIIAAVAWWNPAFLGMSSQTQTSLYLTAASMALNGVSALLYKPPNMNNNLTAAEVEQNKGFYFNGPINLSKQGSPVPLAYGKVMTGSVIIHAGVTTVEG